VACVPEISQMRRETMNLKLENPVRFSSWDIETERIRWDPDRPNFLEQFQIIRGFIRRQQAACAERVSCLICFGETSP
jgi:hypothetical protein